MSTNPISLYSHPRFVSKLFSLTGPRENLPTILTEILSKDEDQVRQNLENSLEFTAQEISIITGYFENACLMQITA